MGTKVMQTIDSEEQLMTLVLSGTIGNPGHLANAAMRALFEHKIGVVFHQSEHMIPWQDDPVVSSTINFNVVFEFDAQKIQANFVIEPNNTGIIFGLTSGSYWSKYDMRMYHPIVVTMALAEFDAGDDYDYIHTTIMGTMNHSLRSVKTAYLHQKNTKKAY